MGYDRYYPSNLSDVTSNFFDNPTTTPSSNNSTNTPPASRPSWMDAPYTDNSAQAVSNTTSTTTSRTTPVRDERLDIEWWMRQYPHDPAYAAAQHASYTTPSAPVRDERLDIQWWMRQYPNDPMYAAAQHASYTTPATPQRDERLDIQWWMRQYPNDPIYAASQHASYMTTWNAQNRPSGSGGSGGGSGGGGSSSSSSQSSGSSETERFELPQGYHDMEARISEDDRETTRAQFSEPIPPNATSTSTGPQYNSPTNSVPSLDSALRRFTRTGTFVPVDYNPGEYYTQNIRLAPNIQRIEYPQLIDDPNTRREVLNENHRNIQNEYGYPSRITDPDEMRVQEEYENRIWGEHRTQMLPAEYNYAIETSGGHKQTTLEENLIKIRATLGLPVHGMNNVARSMKYYTYNRFKVPDPNLAFNKSFTYVFFTRPDLNLLDCDGTASHATINRQAANHTETAMFWQKNPDLFKLLTDGRRCGDSDNFNLLLSNQVASFEIKDENLNTFQSTRSWGDYSIQYGGFYQGRTAGELSCSFTETNDFSILGLIKLWITYIDNVARGAWSPSYSLLGQSGLIDNSYVFTKTLDYPSSAYVFKCGPDGSDILYWTKYYGIFPITTGASTLGWELTQPIGESPKLNITFKYSYKKDLSPVSLLEFNRNAGITPGMNMAGLNEEPFMYGTLDNPHGRAIRPFVGCPYIDFEPKENNVSFKPNSGNESPTSIFRLKFKALSADSLTDDKLYRARSRALSQMNKEK